MRRGSNVETWRNEHDEVIAFNLGADYCAEHEWGITKLKMRLGIESPDYKSIGSALNKMKDFMNIKTHKTGISTRTISKSDGLTSDLDGVKLTTPHETATPLYGFAVVESYRSDKLDFSEIRDNWYYPERNEFLAWWDEGTFAVLTPIKQDVIDMLEAFKTNDIAIWLGGSGPFKNAGLVIGIISRLPEDFKQDCEDTDVAYIALQKASIKTGIHEKLKKADKKYYALSPRWKDEDTKVLQYWLNPNDQINVNYGWFSVADLEAWCKDEGPIPKVAEIV